MNSPSPEAFSREWEIRQGTYPELGDWAVDLYRRLDHGQRLYDESIDFGEVALDIGGRRGVYVSTIRALGPSVVRMVEPEAYEVRQAIAHGIIPAEAAFEGSLEAWVESGQPQADSAFLFNMMPRLAKNLGFFRALSQSIRPGGLVVTSFVEPITNLGFFRQVQANPDFGMRPLVTSPDKRAALGGPIGPSGPRHTFLSIWRREE